VVGVRSGLLREEWLGLLGLGRHRGSGTSEGAWGSRLQGNVAPDPPPQALQGQGGGCSPPLQGPEGGEEQRDVGVLVHGDGGVGKATPLVQPSWLYFTLPETAFQLFQGGE